MNESSEFRAGDDDLDIEQLVDGELNDERRREVLVRMDREPGGWRRCAMAFLESQAWGQAARDMTHELEQPAREPQVQPAQRAKAWWAGPAGTFLAMAASFALAFTLGMLVRFPAGDAGAGPRDVVITPPGGDAKSVEYVGSKGSPEADAWRTFTVTVPGQPGQADVPFLATDGFDPEWLLKQPDAVSPDFQRQLHKKGLYVDQHRQLVPVPMDDGGQLFLPVDQVEVRYVGHQ
jgi:hypothetical protein